MKELLKKIFKKILKKFSEVIKETGKRMTSPVFWTEMALIGAMFLRTVGAYDMPNEQLVDIQNTITTLFTVFATLNNPTDKKNF